MVSSTRGSGELAAERRHINLTQGERAELLERQQMEQAIGLFLDLTADHTWKEIADTLGISLSALKRMTQSGEFQRLYDDTLATVGHDPRLQAVKSSLGDLLPSARRRLALIISNPQSDDRTAMRAIEKLFDWTGVADGVQADDPTMFQNFLKQHGAALQGDVNILNVNIPPEYLDAFARFLRPEGTDTDVVEADACLPGDVHAEDGLPTTGLPDSPSTTPCS